MQEADRVAASARPRLPIDKWHAARRKLIERCGEIGDGKSNVVQAACAFGKLVQKLLQAGVFAVIAGADELDAGLCLRRCEQEGRVSMLRFYIFTRPGKKSQQVLPLPQRRSEIRSGQGDVFDA